MALGPDGMVMAPGERVAVGLLGLWNNRLLTMASQPCYNWLVLPLLALPAGGHTRDRAQCGGAQRGGRAAHAAQV